MKKAITVLGLRKEQGENGTEETNLQAPVLNMWDHVVYA
jgi:hypothetical protein